MKRFPISTLRGNISAPRSNFDMVDTDSESSHRALFVETNAASDLPERTLYRVVTHPFRTIGCKRTCVDFVRDRFWLSLVCLLLLDYFANGQADASSMGTKCPQSRGDACRSWPRAGMRLCVWRFGACCSTGAWGDIPGQGVRLLPHSPVAPPHRHASPPPHPEPLGSKAFQSLSSLVWVFCLCVFVSFCQSSYQ